MTCPIPDPTRRHATHAALILGLLTATLLPLPAAAAREGRLYEVTITNATYGQRFTPILLVTHEPEVRLFEVGAPASAGLVTLAEEGNVGPLRLALDAEPGVNMTSAGAGIAASMAAAAWSLRIGPGRTRWPSSASSA